MPSEILPRTDLLSPPKRASLAPPVHNPRWRAYVTKLLSSEMKRADAVREHLGGSNHKHPLQKKGHIMAKANSTGASRANTGRLDLDAELAAMRQMSPGQLQQKYAEVLAKLGQVSRARMTQIMNLLNLAPDIQEEILFLPRVEKGRDPVGERDVRKIVAEVEWGKQREVWKRQITRL